VSKKLDIKVVVQKEKKCQIKLKEYILLKYVVFKLKA